MKSLPTSATAHSAAPRTPRARQTLLVADQWNDHADERETHGGMVCRAAAQTGDLLRSDVWEVDLGLAAPQAPFHQSDWDTHLERFVAAPYASHLHAVSDALELVTRNPDSSIRVINVSNSMPKSKLAHDLMHECGVDPSRPSRPLPSGEQLAGWLQSPNRSALRSDIVELVHRAVEASPEVAEARIRHLQASIELEERGILYINSAGNEGDRHRANRAVGLQVPDDFYLSNIGHGLNLSVGAVETHKGWLSTSQRVAPYTSCYAGADLSADGTIRNPSTQPRSPRTVSGTSFSAPKVAGFATALALQGVPLGGILGALFSTLTPTPEHDARLGKGVVNFDRAAQHAGWNNYKGPRS